MEGHQSRDKHICPATTCYTEDEIDLYELLLILWRKKLIILFCFFLGITLAVLYVFSIPRVYRQTILVKLPVSNIPISNMPISDTLSIPLLTAAEAREYLLELKQLLKERNFEKLSKTLGLTKDQIKEIIQILPQTIKGQPSLLKIVIETTNPELLPILSKRVLMYLNKNPYLEEKLFLWRRTLKEKKNLIQNKLENLRKLRNFLIKRIKEGHIVTLGFNPLDLDGYIIELEQKLELIKTQQELLKGVEIISRSPLPKRPYKPKVASILTVAAFSGFFLGVFLAFFLEWWENARKKHILKLQQSEK